VNEWVFTYGPPAELIADNGRQFTSRFFQDVCKILTIHNSFTTTYHPQTNGQVERFNRTILSALRTYIADHPRDWDLYSSALTYAYNSSPQTSTALAPFELVLSRPPGPLAVRKPVGEPQEQRSFKAKWKTWLQKAIAETKDKLIAAQQRYKRNYDKKLRRNSETIEADDFVFLRVERRDPNETRHKLAPIADGPYKVKSVNNDNKTLVIYYDDGNVETVSRSRVVKAPRSTSDPKIDVQPSTLDVTIADYPKSEEMNAQHLSGTAPKPLRMPGVFKA